MKARSLGMLALALLLACGGSVSEPARVSSGDLRLSAALEPAAGRVGENHLWLEVSDAEGRPIADPALRVKVHMAAMGAMPAMGGPARVEAVAGSRHRADFSLDMGGTWTVEIDATGHDGTPRHFTGSLTVGSPGLRLRAEGGSTLETRHPGEFAFDPARLQKVGVRITPVERRSIGGALRTIGRVAYDETGLEDVSSRIRGWIQELYADALGQRVKRGEVLFTVYSPEVHAAQQELLQAQRSEGAMHDALLRAARNRLRLWGIDVADVDRIVARGQPLDAVPVRSPADGYVIEKNVVAGSAIEPGQRLLRIAPLDRVWIDVDLYEADLASVHPGQEARVTPSHTLLQGADQAFAGRVAYVYPYLSGATRTARARIVLANPDLVLRPDMFANVEIATDARTALVVPEGAVLYAGERRFVFVELGEGRFRPQRVEVGARREGTVEILDGVAEGERVVSSGTFLIASESRLRAALEQW